MSTVFVHVMIRTNRSESIDTARVMAGTIEFVLVTTIPGFAEAFLTYSYEQHCQKR